MAKSAFRSRSTLLSSPSNSCGSRYRIDFCESLDERGVYTVVPQGKTDMQEFINSFFDDVDIYSILTRILRGATEKTDVVSQLDDFLKSTGNVSGGIYADISQLPNNIHDLHKGYSEMVKLFSSLPSDIRVEYHNSVDEFVAHFDKFVDKYSSSKGSSVFSSSEGSTSEVEGGSDNG